MNAFRISTTRLSNVDDVMYLPYSSVPNCPIDFYNNVVKNQMGVIIKWANPGMTYYAFRISTFELTYRLRLVMLTAFIFDHEVMH